MNNTFDKVIELLSKLPGVGPRQAKRFAYAIIGKNPAYAEDLIRAIGQLRSEIVQCQSCLRYYAERSDVSGLCLNCASPNTDSTSLMIVSKDVDLENIEKTGLHSGRYFVLGGMLPILEQQPERKIRIGELRTLLSELGELEEIILALSANPVGDNTVDYLRQELPVVLGERAPDVRITVLGRGLSTGTELEYSDADTLRHALENRG